jgi:hypothetical protein
LSILLCPGMHEPTLTDGFLAGLQESWQTATPACPALLIYPTQIYPAYSPWHILKFLEQQTAPHKFCGVRGLRPCEGALPPHPHDPAELTSDLSLVFIGFSAGVVGAIAAAQLWQSQGNRVKALIALDGWGVPLYGSFPIHRLSHDQFTHWSSAWLGAGEDGFYADPPVDHLTLWRSPQQVRGWQTPQDKTSQSPVQTTAAQFLVQLLHRYGETPSRKATTIRQDRGKT